jgi:hypothetical protein
MLPFDVPPRYVDLLSKVADLEVSYGSGGLKLYPLEELPDGQIGYSIGTDGSSLCSTDAGGWQSNWIVIGSETGLGDPLIMDITHPDLPVFTSMAGVGRWDLKPIAVSIEAFVQCLAELSNIAKDRTSPVELSENPLTGGDQKAFGHRIAKLNDQRLKTDFWDILLDY